MVSNPVNKSSRFFYGWIILAIALLSMTLAYGMQSSFPVFFVPMLNEFGSSRASTAGILSTFVVVYGIAAPFVGRLIDKVGPRRVLPIGIIIMSIGLAASGLTQAVWQLYITFGLLVGTGVCFLGFASQIPIVTNWFVRRRGLAYGIVLAGFGTCASLAYLSQVLIAALGWRGAYFTLAGIVITVLLPLVVIFMRTRPQDIGLSPDGDSLIDEAEKGQPSEPRDLLVLDKTWADTTWTLDRALRSPRFWALLFANLCIWGAGMNTIFTHQVAFMQDVGYSPFFAASLVAVFGICNAVGSLLGMISDRIGRETTYTLGTLIAMIAAIILLLTKDASSPWAMYFYAISLGVGMGICAAPITGAAADLFQGENFGVINGAITMGYGLGGAVFPWLAGYIYDLSGSYQLAFMIALSGILAACLLVWLSAPRQVRAVPGKMKNVVG